MALSAKKIVSFSLFPFSLSSFSLFFVCVQRTCPGRPNNHQNYMGGTNKDQTAHFCSPPDADKNKSVPGCRA